MARYYTVDRASRLRAGTVAVCDTDFSQCRFFPIQDHFTKTDLEGLVAELFPSGLSSHGKSYLLDQCLVVSTDQGPAPYAPHIPMIELVSELVRRSLFPEKPSRYTVLFAWSSLEEARAFKESHGGGIIYEVEAKSGCKADMNMLFLGGSGIGALLFAMKYWRGDASPNPKWEHLLVPPVQILGEVM